LGEGTKEIWKSIACEEMSNSRDAHLNYFKSVWLSEKSVMVII